MKKRIWHLSRCVVVCTAFLFVQQFIQSQVSNPSTWESFVQSNANISIRDTFRMQTFEGLPTDNWDYAITGENTRITVNMIHASFALRYYFWRSRFFIEGSYNYGFSKLKGSLDYFEQINNPGIGIGMNGTFFENYGIFFLTVFLLISQPQALTESGYRFFIFQR